MGLEEKFYLLPTFLNQSKTTELLSRIIPCLLREDLTWKPIGFPPMILVSLFFPRNTKFSKYCLKLVKKIISVIAKIYLNLACAVLEILKKAH